MKPSSWHSALPVISKMDEALQKALQKLIDDGTYMKILKYWGVQDGAISKPEINTPGTNE